MQFEPKVLFQKFPNIHNCGVSLFSLVGRLKEIGVHNFSNYFTFFILLNEDIFFLYPINLIPFLPEKNQSPDQICQDLHNFLIAKHVPSVIEQSKVRLKGVGWPFEDGVDIGDNRAKVVGLHGIRINQPDHMRTLILLELAQLDEDRVMLLRGVSHHLLYDVSVLVFEGEQLE